MYRKLVFFVCLVLVISCAPVSAMSGPAPQPSSGGEKPAAVAGKMLIDDFESGSLKSPRDWWTFDIARATPASNADLTAGDAMVAAEVGKYSLHLEGPARNWYAGGCGTYIAKENKDLSKYNSFSIDVFGRGSGTLKVELYDDDNKNWQVEQDPAKSYAPIYDDKFIYDIKIDWDGWKRVVIPLADFVDDNPGVGDDVWNPQQIEGSGGLLQIQFVCIAGKDTGDINYNVDNIYLTTGEK